MRLCPRGHASSEVRPYNNAPALFVNGKLTSYLIGYVGRSRDVEDFSRAGIHILDMGIPFGWVGPESYDFTRTDRAVEDYLKQSDKLLLLPRFDVSAPSWWCTAFPDEIARREDASAVRFPNLGAPCHPSFASTQYRRLALAALRAFLTHLESKYGDRIVGYFPGNGVYGEWFSYHSYWEVRPGAPPPADFGVEDYSRPAQVAFREWLGRKYGRDEAALRKSWGDAAVTFATARVPSAKARNAPHRGIFFDPGVSTQVPDYFEFFNDLVSDVLVEQARVAKSAVGGRKVIGAFYGYLFADYANLNLNRSGHLGLHKVLHSPDVDFIASPYSYNNRAVGGPNLSQTLPETIALHGKLYFNEADTESHLQKRQWRWGNSLRNPENFEQTRGLLLRDFAYAFSKRFGMWYMDLLGGMFHDADITGLMARVRSLDEKWIGTRFEARPEIAVVLDEASFRYFSDDEQLSTALLSAQQQFELGYIGAPFDAILLDDLADPRLPDYKLYIPLNAFRLTAAQRHMMHRRFARNGATVLWVYAPGFIAEKLSLEAIRELTGIAVRAEESPGDLRVNITDRRHPFTRSLAGAAAYGTDVNVEGIRRWFDHQFYLKDIHDPALKPRAGFQIAPRFWVDDPSAKVLGQLAGVERPGLAVKRVSGWTSVYSSAPIVPAALIREIARTAGCHIYSDGGDVVYANSGFVGIYSPRGGEREIHLPRAARVTDMMEDRLLVPRARSVKLALTPGGAVLLRLE